MPLGRDTSGRASFTRSPIPNECLSCFAKTIGIKKTLLDNFKRAILEAKHVNEFRPDDVLWEKISKGMLRNPDRLLKNTDKRMVYMYNNMFFVKKDFTFGCRTDAPPAHGEWISPGDFRQRKRFDQKAYKLPPPTPAHVPAETHKRPLEQQPKPLSKKKRVIITPIIRPSVPSVRIIKPSTALSTPQPVSIPDPSPEQTTSQILLPDPPVVETTSQIHLPDPPEQTTSQILLPDPPEQTTSQILLPDPPVVETTSQILLPDPPSNQTTSQIYLPEPPSNQTTDFRSTI
ncbi:hypothetical protein TNCV_3788351 [Trichonephila clavipes]|nr:hypothetical protein TNCV_3788351 [Trichonephila clavipes]